MLLIYHLLKFCCEKSPVISDDDIGRYITSYIFISALAKELEKAKDLYFNNAKVEEMEKYRRNKEKYKLAEKKLYDENNKLQVENTKLKSENKNLINNTSELEREVKRLRLELQENKDSKQELNKLREFIFDLNNETEEEYNNKVDLELLNSKKVIIVGESPSWQTKMKEVLPNYKFISVENMNFDVKSLDNVELVIILTNYLNHGLYYKVINHIRDKDISLEYLEDNNIDICLKKLSNLFI